MESHYNEHQNLVIGYLRSIRLCLLPNKSLLTERYDKNEKYDNGYIPLIIIHFTYNYYYRKINFFMLSSGSSEAQNPKYNQFKLINVPNLYEQENNLKYDNIQYVIKLHSWNKNLNPLTAKLNQAGPQKKKKKSIKSKNKKNSNALTVRKKKSGKNLVLPGTIRSAPNSPKSDKKNKRHSLNVTGIKNSGKINRNHFNTKSTGFLPGLNIGQILDEEEEEKRSGSRSKKKTKQSHIRRAKSMAVMPKMQEMPMSKINNNVNFDRYSYGKCLVSLFELPKWGWLKKKKLESGNGRRYGNYHLFLRCGGIKSEFDDHTNEIDLILFNSVNCNYNGLNKDVRIIIDAYYQKLPSFRKTMESPYIIYNQKKQTLYSFGGYCDGKALSTINECHLNVGKVSGLKWKRNRNKQQMNKGRYGCSICDIGNDKYIILGGTNQKSKSEKTCEIYNNYDKCEADKCTEISNMSFKRSKLTSVFIPEKNKVIAVGGMIYGKGSTQIEIYDLIKNKWILHKSEFNFEHKYPLIWMDFYNPNICYVAGDWIGFGGRKDSLGYIEWIDLRIKGQKKWKMFNDDTLGDMFKIQGVRANLWESRLLTML